MPGIDWLNIPVGAGVAVLLIREASRFITERHNDRNGGGGIGQKSVEFWETRMREIVYSEMKRHIFERLDRVDLRLTAVHNIVNEMRWRRRRDSDWDNREDDDG